MKTQFLQFLAGLLACATLAVSAAAVPASTRSFDTDRIVVKYKSTQAQGVSASADTRRAVAMGQRARTSLKAMKSLASGAIVYRTAKRMSPAEARLAALRIAADPAVAYAAPDVRVYAAADPASNDPHLPNQWSIAASGDSPRGAAGHSAVWPITQGQGVVVAVVDSGSVSHPDLSGNELQGYDFVSDLDLSGDGDARDADPSDPGDYCTDAGSVSSWHGLKVASQIAALTNNGSGIAGGAPLAKVLQVRALGRCGAGWLSDIADALVWSVGGSVTDAPANASPAKVVNLSLGGTPGEACHPYMQDAVDEALWRGAVVVVAAGNESDSSLGSPANCSGVVTVGAHTRSGDLAAYSNHSAELTLTAPGGGGCAAQQGSCDNTPTFSLGNDGQTSAAASTSGDHFSGTSSAAPHVSAAVALMLELDPQLTPARVKALLRATARPHAGDSFCAANADRCGAGMLDAQAVVYALADVAVSIEGPSESVQSGVAVTLQARVTPAGDYAYEWTQTQGPQVPLRNAGGSALGFTTPNARAELQFKVRATRADGLFTEETFGVAVQNPPVLTVADFSFTLAPSGAQPALTRNLTVFDADGDAVLVNLLSGPAGAVINGTTLSWPTPVEGPAVFVVQAEDSSGQLGTRETFTVTVAPAGSGDGPGGGGDSGGNDGAEESGGGGGSFSLLGLGLLALAASRAQSLRKREG